MFLTIVFFLTYLVSSSLVFNIMVVVHRTHCSTFIPTEHYNPKFLDLAEVGNFVASETTLEKLSTHSVNIHSP